MDRYEYDVAISFADEDRSVAEQLADLLKERGLNVFYDKYERATLWGTDLYDQLTTIYTNKAKYCVVLISQYYVRKQWTNLERRSAQSRSLKQSDPYILPVRLDDTPIEGLLPTIRYEDLRTTPVDQLADLVQQKIGQIHRQEESKGVNDQGTVDFDPAPTHALPNIPVKITQRDKDRYLRETFAFVKEYFQIGIAKLNQTYSKIQVDYDEIHAHKFVCRAYVDGDLKSQCKIWLGSLFGGDGICYSAGRIEVDRDTSMNDWISVTENKGVVVLEASGMSGRAQKSPMLKEDAAAHFWSSFIQPLDSQW